MNIFSTVLTQPFAHRSKSKSVEKQIEKLEDHQVKQEAQMSALVKKNASLLNEKEKLDSELQKLSKEKVRLFVLAMASLIIKV